METKPLEELRAYLIERLKDSEGSVAYWLRVRDHSPESQPAAQYHTDAVADHRRWERWLLALDKAIALTQEHGDG